MNKNRVLGLIFGIVSAFSLDIVLANRVAQGLQSCSCSGKIDPKTLTCSGRMICQTIPDPPPPPPSSTDGGQKK